MDLPDDDQLTQQGLALNAPPAPLQRVLLIACGALAREILDLIARNGWDHMDLTCLPAILHNHPERIPQAVEQDVLKHRAAYDRIFVVYADCGTGGQLQTVCERLGVGMVAGPHCYSFFEGNAQFAANAPDEFTAFYLTDFLVRQFDAFVWEPLGLDRHPQLRDTYFGHYTKLVYQAQTDDAALTAKAQDCAARLGLAFERRFTGYGDLEAALAGVSVI
ncbi:MAG: DUF1638 domain-containing protein [Paracoccaceae bacterium]|uniref:DUF1638 domain-containing protein n=1 Tax=Seohaeicola saemankumensis TaxID=481181 RepID=UPI001E499BD1|nr:DUF1638 domain-containing protein [Seohaeicola saemankumensis]MCD1624688.1 DUF1638 domain-containing protein [Seohaeicola saemankumensis]